MVRDMCRFEVTIVVEHTLELWLANRHFRAYEILQALAARRVLSRPKTCNFESKQCNFNNAPHPPPYCIALLIQLDTMPEPKTITSLSGSVESDMDDELENAMPEAFPTPESNQENNVAPVRKGRPRGKAAAAKFTKTKAPARGVSGGAAVTKKKAAPKKKAAGKRQPLKEQTNIQHGSDTEEVDDFEAQKNKDADSIEDVSVEEEVKKQPVKRKPAARGKKKAEAEEKEAGTEVEAPNQTIERDGEFEYTPTVSRRSRTVAKPAGAVHKAVAGRSRAAKEIPETQTEPMEVEPSSLHMDEDVIPQSVYRQTSNFRAHSNTRQPPAISRRTGNASDAERTSNDPALRRKLGDLTKKLESMELKYNNLREVGIREAESNFEKLKVQSEAKTKGTSHLEGYGQRLICAFQLRTTS